MKADRFTRNVVASAIKEEERRAYGVDAIATPSSKVMGGKVDNDIDDRRLIGGRRCDCDGLCWNAADLKQWVLPRHFWSTSYSEIFLYDAN